MCDTITSEIPSVPVCDALFKTIENELQSKNYQINLTVASQAGVNNFIGNIYRINFSKKIENNNDHNQTKSVIVKTAPQNLARRQLFFVRTAFAREVYMYNKVLPFLCEFERSKIVDIEKNGFTEYPKSYAAVDVDLNEGLIFEDLSVRGFTTVDRHKEDITADHVYLVMKILGKFHAISFALKDQQPDKFNELTSNLSEVFVRKDDERLGEIINQHSEKLLKVVSGDKDDHLLTKVKKLCDKGLYSSATDCLELEDTEFASVIGHGDIWQNNTMFRYEHNGKPIEVCLLDWQTSRHSSPVIDIVYFIFCCTTKTLRDAHYDNFLDTYYESLSEHIKMLGSDPETLFPRELMSKHLHQFAKFALILSVLLLPMLTTDSGHAIDIDKVANDIDSGKETSGTHIFISDKSRSKLDERMRDVIVDMARLEYI